MVGDRRPYNVALIVADTAAAAAYADRDEVVAEIARAVERANAGLSRPEQIRRFRLLDDDWQPGGEELTPTLKLKRRPITARYAAEIEALYAEAAVTPG